MFDSVGSLGMGSLGLGSLGLGSLSPGSLGLQLPEFTGTLANITGNNGVAITAYDSSVHFTDVSIYVLQDAPSWMLIDSLGEITGIPDAAATTNNVTVTGFNSIGDIVSNTFDVIIT